jgi:hypothetical protein
MKPESILTKARRTATFRFSLARLICVVLAIALALAALVNASRGGAALLFTTTLVALLIAPLGILYRRGPKRAFWVGFSFLGSVYLLLAYGPWFSRAVEPELVTTKFMTFVHPIIAKAVPYPESSAGLGGGGFGGGGLGGGGMGGLGGGVVLPGGGYGYLYPYVTDFVRVGHALTALLLAWFGGRLAAYFHATNSDNEPSPT